MDRPPPLVLSLLTLLLATATARAGNSPIVVELFTSQGCSACRPAERYFGELAKRPGLLALAYHVEYWNYIGWTDPYSRPWASTRQRHYEAALKLPYVYTPEMVIEGSAEGVGSEPKVIEPLIRAAEAKRAPHPPLTLRWRDDGALLADVGSGKAPPTAPATVWLVGYDNLDTMMVTAGENEGKMAWDHHTVRSFRRLGSWAGWSEELVVPADEVRHLGNYAVAVLLQVDGAGPILTAATIRTPPP